MKKIYLLLFFSLILGHVGLTQTSVDCAVQITATVQVSPPVIGLAWVSNASTNQYTLYRKLKTATVWGPVLATLPGTVNSYVDNTVAVGVSYEYKIVRSGAAFTGYGYINAGIQVAAIENRGNLILVVDSTFISSLAPEISRLEEDLEGDGWNVKRLDVLRTGSVTNVKAKIVATYNQDPANTKALFILGHVPVPYSGNLNPDGHANHQGAWPTDGFYADIDGIWTDVSVSSPTISPARTQNVPGDGKYDQSILPSGIELQTGRVDLYNLTTFTVSETQLMKNYLNKDHDYRKKIFAVQKKAVIDDNFGYMSGEAFAASGYHNFAPLVHSSNVVAADYFTTMTGTVNSYLWSYGCGAGSFSSAGGIGNTGNFANADLQGVFTMLFGSYFGDWDSQNNFLRAPLAQGKMLTCSWSGRPHHQYHHMALGENIGYSMKVTQNYQGPLYYPNIYGITGAWIMTGLMGDPTLRNDVVAPVSDVVATKNGYNCDISWTASTETNVLGYNVYMKNDTNKIYVKLNPTPIAGTNYTDLCLLHPGIYKYMVRAIKLEETPSGTYYNLSEGIADTAYNSNNMQINAQFTISIVSNTVSFSNVSSGANSYSWTFGDGSGSNLQHPINAYANNGTYTVTLIATNDCHADTVSMVININSVDLRKDLANKLPLNFFPNPSRTWVTVENVVCTECVLVIYNSEGKQVYRKVQLTEREIIDVSSLCPGIYLLKFGTEDGDYICKKLIIE